MIIRKVCINKTSGQKFITIPRSCKINAGDYVEVIKKEFKDDEK